MNVRSLAAITLAAVVGLAAGSSAKADTYAFVGSYSVGDGPNWTTNPAVYSAREAAAHIFGGSYTDYAISTNSNTTDPSTINFLAHVDGWGDAQYLTHPVSQDFKLDSGAPGYNDPYGGPAYSAYVQDHSVAGQYVNYVWKDIPSNIAAAPLPSTAWGGMTLLGGLGLLRLRQRKAATV